MKVISIEKRRVSFVWSLNELKSKSTWKRFTKNWLIHNITVPLNLCFMVFWQDSSLDGFAVLNQKRVAFSILPCPKGDLHRSNRQTVGEKIWLCHFWLSLSPCFTFPVLFIVFKEPTGQNLLLILSDCVCEEVFAPLFVGAQGSIRTCFHCTCPDQTNKCQWRMKRVALLGV